MIKINDLVLNEKATFGEIFYLTGVRENQEFEDGKPTGINGMKYEVACPQLSFEKFNVVIEGNVIEEHKELGNNEQCNFKNLNVSLYQDFRTKEIKASGKASEVIING